MTPVPFKATQLKVEKCSAVASTMVIPSSQIAKSLPASAIAFLVINTSTESLWLKSQVLFPNTVSVRVTGPGLSISSGPGLYTGFKMSLAVKVPSPEVAQEKVAALVTSTPSTKLKVTVSSSHIVKSAPKSTVGKGSIIKVKVS